MRAGRGLLAIWNDIAPGGEDAFRRWHSGEHLRERLSVPGFLRGRRLFGGNADPRWLTLYETESPRILSSPAYLARLNSPSDWTNRTLPLFSATERMACRVVHAVGIGRGGTVLSVRSRAPGGEALPAFCSMADAVVATGAATAAFVASAVVDAPQQTAERSLRRDERVPPAAAAFLELVAEVEPDVVLRDLEAGVQVDRYRLEHEVVPGDW